LSTVKSSAMTPRHPSVPNLIAARWMSPRVGSLATTLAMMPSAPTTEPGWTVAPSADHAVVAQDAAPDRRPASTTVPRHRIASSTTAPSPMRQRDPIAVTPPMRASRAISEWWLTKIRPRRSAVGWTDAPSPTQTPCAIWSPAISASTRCSRMSACARWYSVSVEIGCQ
jgi:hypothetical protein